MQIFTLWYTVCHIMNGTASCHVHCTAVASMVSCVDAFGCIHLEPGSACHPCLICCTSLFLEASYIVQGAEVVAHWQFTTRFSIFSPFLCIVDPSRSP
jgi:hypothetical protein